MSKFICARISDDDMLGLLEDAQDLLSLAESLVSRAEVLVTLVCELVDVNDSNVHARSEAAMQALHGFANHLHSTGRRVAKKFEGEGDA